MMPSVLAAGTPEVVGGTSGAAVPSVGGAGSAVVEEGVVAGFGTPAPSSPQAAEARLPRRESDARLSLALSFIRAADVRVVEPESCEE
jgi:hypothetical protein